MGGGGGTLYAIKAGVTGDISLKAGETSNTYVAWSVGRAWPAAATPLVYDGYVYVLERNGGFISCFDAKTGKAAYTKERIPNAQAFWASPWAYNGQIFCLDESGATHVVKAGPNFELIRKNTTVKDVFWSTPAVAGGTVILRGIDQVICVK
jgi:outer membrane protein assembly factor BamB